MKHFPMQQSAITHRSHYLSTKHSKSTWQYSGNFRK